MDRNDKISTILTQNQIEILAGQYEENYGLEDYVAEKVANIVAYHGRLQKRKDGSSSDHQYWKTIESERRGNTSEMEDAHYHALESEGSIDSRLRYMPGDALTGEKNINSAQTNEGILLQMYLEQLSEGEFYSLPEELRGAVTEAALASPLPENLPEYMQTNAAIMKREQTNIKIPDAGEGSGLVYRNLRRIDVLTHQPPDKTDIGELGDLVSSVGSYVLPDIFKDIVAGGRQYIEQNAMETTF